MRVGWSVAVLVAALLVGAPRAAGGVQDGLGASCAATAARPRSVTVAGRPMVTASHAVVCESPVGEIVVRGALTMNGDEVDRAARRCAGATRCVVSTAHPNPPGVQVWRGLTSGRVVFGSRAVEVRSAASPYLKA